MGLFTKNYKKMTKDELFEELRELHVEKSKAIEAGKLKATKKASKKVKLARKVLWANFHEKDPFEEKYESFNYKAQRRIAEDEDWDAALSG